MANKIHGRATTTPAIRKIIQESKDTIAVLAARYNINPKTVIKWKHRQSVQDKKCGPPSESKSLTKREEAIHRRLLLFAQKNYTSPFFIFFVSLL